MEECDSTWEPDSESDEHQPGGEEEDSGISESMSPADAVRGAEQLDHGSRRYLIADEHWKDKGET